jgi:alkyl hydroperoxide reductase subunit AhpC
MEYTLKPRKEGGLGPMDIPLVSDINKEISKAYGCLCEDGGDTGVSYRATYIIDRNGIVRHSSINDLPVGRNPDEYLRLVKAFQYVDTHGEVCPAGWQPGAKTMIPDAKQDNYKNVISGAH